MLVEKVKFKGFDGEDIEETVRLNLTKAECMNLDLKYEMDGGLINYLRKLLTANKDKDEDALYKPLLDFLQTIILAAYGKKTDDGRFVKKMNGIPLSEEFESSEAYSELIISLLEGRRDIEKFLLGIFPEIPNEEYEKKKNAIANEFPSMTK